jgi:hypothetical protein
MYAQHEDASRGPGPDALSPDRSAGIGRTDITDANAADHLAQSGDAEFPAVDRDKRNSGISESVLRGQGPATAADHSAGMRRHRYNSPTLQRIYVRYCAKYGEHALRMIGSGTERGYPISAGEDASRAAHWYFVLHPEDRPDPDAACSHAGKTV